MSWTRCPCGREKADGKCPLCDSPALTLSGQRHQRAVEKRRRKAREQEERSVKLWEGDLALGRQLSEALKKRDPIHRRMCEQRHGKVRR